MNIRTLLPGAGVLIAAALLSAQATPPASDWPIHGRDAGAMRFSPLKQITTQNVSKLKLAWTYDTPAEVPPPVPDESANDDVAPAAGAVLGNVPAANPERPRPIQSEAPPLVVNGVMYLASAYNRIVALDADTGREIWVKNIGHQPSMRGLAYWPGMTGYGPRLVFGTTDSAALLNGARRNNR